MLERRLKRQKRMRTKIRGREDLLRLSVFRSNKYIYAQAINDRSGETLVSVSEKETKEGPASTQRGEKTKTERSKALGILLASKLKKKKKNKIVFDRRGFRYHGRVRALAEGLREGGIKF